MEWSQHNYNCNIQQLYCSMKYEKCIIWRSWVWIRNFHILSYNFHILKSFVVEQFQYCCYSFSNQYFVLFVWLITLLLIITDTYEQLHLTCHTYLSCIWNMVWNILFTIHHNLLNFVGLQVVKLYQRHVLFITDQFLSINSWLLIIQSHFQAC